MCIRDRPGTVQTNLFIFYFLLDLFNTLYDDVNRTSNKTEKEIKLEILHHLLIDYKNYKINKTMDDMMDIDTTYIETDKK